jgi:hypothetical protein
MKEGRSDIEKCLSSVARGCLEERTWGVRRFATECGNSSYYGLQAFEPSFQVCFTRYSDLLHSSHSIDRLLASPVQIYHGTSRLCHGSLTRSSHRVNPDPCIVPFLDM